MTGARSPRRLVPALVVALLVSVAGLGALATPAPAASPHRAAVIVDTGSTVKRVVITFTEDSITGIDALQRAGMNPSLYQFGGQGGAVCRLLGVGRDPGPNCLGGADGDPRYWAYFRAPAGSSSFKYSQVGGGAARVHDGDVEGWKFGTGTPPQYVSLASLLPPPPPTQPPPTAPPATSAPSGGGTGASVGGATAGSPGGSAAPGTQPQPSTLPATGGKDNPTSATADGGTTKDDRTTDGSSARAAGAEDDGKAVDTALASSESDGGGGSTWSLALFAILLLAIVAAIVIVRRVRNHAAAG